MGTHVNYSGLVIAGVGFFLTRFTVTLAVYEASVRFYLAGVVPLALGLGLAAFGVALAVADVDATLVRTTAMWCVVGLATMLVLVALTLLGATTGGVPDLATVRSRTYLSNFLIGGSVGGTLTGLYASRNRQQRDTLRQQTNRLEVLNRMLRHEVLNAVMVIQGYADLDDESSDAGAAIEEKSAAIERTVEEVKYLARGDDGPRETAVDVDELLSESVARARERYPDVDLSVAAGGETPPVGADDRVERVFTHLVENAASVAETVTVSTATTARSVRVAVRDDGPGLPSSQRRLLETGDIAEYDDPDTGFGLNVVRLLVEEYGGRIETDVGDDGTTVTVTLPRATAETTETGLGGPNPIAVRPSVPHLVVILGAALIAGVCYGVAAEAFGGSVGFIGIYYGVQNGVVGWIGHEFHSVVFAFAFASIASLLPDGHRDSVATYVAVGTAWGVVLWALAAGFVSPIWLRLLGFPAPIPSFSGMLLVAHLAWGSSLGLLTALGYRSVAPKLARLAG